MIGTANCAKEDATECKITAVGMTDNPNGDFSGAFGIPDSIDFSEDEQKDIGIPEISQLYTERFFTGKRKKVSPSIANPFNKQKKIRTRTKASEIEEQDSEFDWSDLPGFRNLQE